MALSMLINGYKIQSLKKREYSPTPSSELSEESNLNYLDKHLALQSFKLDSSLTLGMTAIVSFKFTTIYESKFLKGNINLLQYHLSTCKLFMLF